MQFADEKEEPSKSKTKKEVAESGDATLDFSDDFFEEKLSTELDLSI